MRAMHTTTAPPRSSKRRKHRNVVKQLDTSVKGNPEDRTFCPVFSITNQSYTSQHPSVTLADQWRLGQDLVELATLTTLHSGRTLPEQVTRANHEHGAHPSPRVPKVRSGDIQEALGAMRALPAPNQSDRAAFLDTSPTVNPYKRSQVSADIRQLGHILKLAAHMNLSVELDPRVCLEHTRLEGAILSHCWEMGAATRGTGVCVNLDAIPTWPEAQIVCTVSVPIVPGYVTVDTIIHHNVNKCLVL
ncbi:protein ORF1A [Cyprinid herpesvirus 1]|uniref:Protein ORF1A n=1 Tax=Cyprinid herpesvirus 1 TaxID=317858 RepID=K7PBC0_9VIRU|nr:protein ORF1A [Cyprinid herpesvirus 1]YP_007003816.1 protein ORF1A [Cyprinid herpesvirus 1]AFJ20314.1 protein ORF1A [Cyprinid herpesvirus 1]AFJ20449.1 protein ORF1A [Cyprinid herpesvirus 1]